VQEVQQERSFCHRSCRGCSEHGAGRRSASARGRATIRARRSMAMIGRSLAPLPIALSRVDSRNTHCRFAEGNVGDDVARHARREHCDLVDGTSEASPDASCDRDPPT